MSLGEMIPKRRRLRNRGQGATSQPAVVQTSSQPLIVETVSLEDVYALIEAKHVSQRAFHTQLQTLMEARVFEGHPLGFLVVWSKKEDASGLIGSIMDQAMHNSWVGKTFSENKGRTAQLLLLDGGTLLDCNSGRVEATTIHFASHASCPFILEGHGTKHQSAVNLSFHWDVVVMVRSVDSGDITVFSPALTRGGRVARVPALAGVPPSMPVGEMTSTMIQSRVMAMMWINIGLQCTVIALLYRSLRTSQTQS